MANITHVLVFLTTSKSAIDHKYKVCKKATSSFTGELPIIVEVVVYLKALKLTAEFPNFASSLITLGTSWPRAGCPNTPGARAGKVVCGTRNLTGTEQAK